MYSKSLSLISIELFEVSIFEIKQAIKEIKSRERRHDFEDFKERIARRERQNIIINQAKDFFDIETSVKTVITPTSKSNINDDFFEIFDVEYHPVPRYFLKQNDVLETEGYFNLSEFSDDEYIYFFNIETADKYLQEIISEGGYEQILQCNDFKNLFNNMEKYNFDNFCKGVFGGEEHLIIETRCQRSYFDNDYDIDTYVVGYLDKDLNKHLI